MTTKTAVRGTSVSAYRNLRHQNTQTQRVHEAIDDMGAATIRMIAKKLNMEISTVSARVNKLVKDGELIESHRDKDPYTKVRSIYWRSAELQVNLLDWLQHERDTTDVA